MIQKQFQLMFNLNKIFPRVLKKHELNNEGCRCPVCQKITYKGNLKIERSFEKDHQSQCYNATYAQSYMKIIYQLNVWEKHPRKIRFALPEICVYDQCHPICFISKRKEAGEIKINRDQSKMHMFEIIRFLLEGFVYHNPISNGQEKEKSHSAKMVAFSKKYKNQCVVLAKYKNNGYHMLTLIQLEDLFKSKQKYLREGLMYLQTLVGTKSYTQTRIKIDLEDLRDSQLLERAKKQVRMILQQIKSTSMDYVGEHDEIKYEKALRQTNIKEYLLYLSLKIILLDSKSSDFAMSEAIFKYIIIKDIIYLWDIRVIKVQSPEKTWVSGSMKAFQYRLSKRMNMIDYNEHDQEEKEERVLSTRGKEMVQWLEKSTSEEWNEMQMIRKRLQKLQKQKKSLMQSQSFSEGGMNLQKSFKVRTMSKR